MLVNHLAKRHPDISLETVPELNLPILKTTKDYFCQYCNKVVNKAKTRSDENLNRSRALYARVASRMKITLR